MRFRLELLASCLFGCAVMGVIVIRLHRDAPVTVQPVVRQILAGPVEVTYQVPDRSPLPDPRPARWKTEGTMVLPDDVYSAEFARDARKVGKTPAQMRALVEQFRRLGQR